MARKQTGFKTKGMNRDLSVSAFNPEFSFENMNLRLSTNENNTLLSWVNERGTFPIGTPGVIIQGVPIGTAIINHYLVLFTHKNSENDVPACDYIYKMKFNGSAPILEVSELYGSSLGFSTSNPIETRVSYESDAVQKVYWTDGINQPRVINIMGQYYKTVLGEREYKPSFIFDFVPELQLNEEIHVVKKLGASGMFAPGVIQYAFTYYNKYCQESNIFYTTPLHYISFPDRGASPEEKVDNAFQIIISNVDTHFEYLRIYSIQRTSINGTPICKRIQDIEIAGLTGNEASYLDTGLSGDNIDPTELLYKGGNAIVASTLEQKDGTLFLGNIATLVNKALDVKENNGLSIDQNPSTGPLREIYPNSVSSKDYIYSSQLTSYNSDGYSVPCAGFKRGDKYRCGVQFQHKTGKWSTPTFIEDAVVYGEPSPAGNHINIPRLKGTIDASVCSSLISKDFVNARAVVVFPNVQDRLTVCQGVTCPTLYTDKQRDIDKNLYAQPSWFFRSYTSSNSVDSTGAVSPVPVSNTNLKYTNEVFNNTYNPGDDKQIREVEIQGEFNANNKFKIDGNTVTFHSPDIEFDTQLYSTDFLNLGARKVGHIAFTKTLSDINIQTETPTASVRGSGFIHKSFAAAGMLGIVSGLFYDDYLVNDTNGSDNDHIGAYDGEYSSCKWMVHTWNKTGSLNNDINRPTDKGVATAKLKKKIISNLRFAENTAYDGSGTWSQAKPQLFSSDQPTILKLNHGINNTSNIYMGNIDTVLNPDMPDGMYFMFKSKNIRTPNVENEFISNNETWWKTFYDEIKNGEESLTGAIYYFDDTSSPPSWKKAVSDFFPKYQDCAVKKDFVRMKYKSTPHLVFTASGLSESTNDSLPVVEIYRAAPTNIFGGTSMDALKENIWIPCGEPVALKKEENGVQQNVDFYYDYGDTYYQRYDCLKTYAYTPEDENQVVEIGSFMLETRINIDGRYDRNRGQLSNINMSPRNFNLLNPVYSQIDNFFTYRIMDEDYYTNTKFPNQITWSKTKESGADVDLWTNVTLASVLELDGDKGKLNKLIRLNDQILAFQDTGISQVLYNENVQVSSTDGVPIEIANSGKVQGKRYLSNTIGCSNKWSMATTPAGIYFMDSHDKSIYLFNGQLTNISNQGGFASWAKNNIFLTGNQWKPDFSTSDFVAYYDKLNQDVLFINGSTALAWSEKLGAFTSFYSYEGTPFLCNLDDTGIWIRNPYETEETIPASVPCKLWMHQAGNYCSFFDTQKPYWMVLVGNPEPQLDKIFTNLEFRACVDGEGAINGGGSQHGPFDYTFDYTFYNNEGGGGGKYKSYIPFDFLETWDEYQHGIAQIDIRSGHSMFKHHVNNTTGAEATLIRKFRIWRCDIPRDNVLKTSEQPPVSVATEYMKDAELGITRYSRKPIDRMRNPWIYLKLLKKADSSSHRTEIHDVVMTYFG